MEINLDLVPQKPGVYMWLDQQEVILYIGKAKKLKSRMRQYFRGMLNSYKTAQLVKNIQNYKYIITKSEKEALILERNLIKKHMPAYNILLTDDKRYPYIKVKLAKTLEVNLVYSVATRNEKATYFGPFPFGYGARKLTHLVQRLSMYEDGLLARNKSLEYWIEKYNYAKRLLASKNTFLIKELEEKMKVYANNFQFELAADIKSNIESLKHNQSKQLVTIRGQNKIDVIAFTEAKGYLFIAMLFYRNGNLLSEKQKVLEVVSSKDDLIRQFVAQYYQVNIKPDFIISNKRIETDLKVIVPQRGKKKQILGLAIANANDRKSNRIDQYKRKEKRTIGAVKSLERLLGIKPIRRIVMIDNSNTNHFEPVSGLVSYVNGIKKQNEYRKFKLAKSRRLADVEYMKQGLFKYFKHNPPEINLLIVDGGKQQISEAMKVVPTSIKVVGLIKNDKHKTKALISSGGSPIKVESESLWLLLSEMQEEADRYAKSYHIKRRRSSLEGFLISIKGIGPKTEAKLLEHFKNYAAIYNAPVSDLQKIVSKQIAKKIKEALNENNRDVR